MLDLPYASSKILTDEELFNRAHEISNLTKLLESTGENNAPDILLTGIGGVGKTVLLNKIKNSLDENYLVVYMDFTYSRSYQMNNVTIEGLLDFYCEKIIEESRLKDLFLTTDGFETDNMGFAFTLPQEIYNHNKDKIDGVIIFIDEFQIIKELDDYLDSFLWNFRGYVTEQRNVAYVLSGSMGLQDNIISEIAGRNGAFGGRMLTININPFTKQTTEDYLNEKASELKFTPEGFERFYKCTSGVPYYINVFARQLPANQDLDEEKVIDAFDSNISLIASHLINEWNRLTIKEKDMIIALLDGPLKRVDLAKKLGVKSGSLSDKLNKLQNLGLIQFINGEYEISEKLLKRWLEIEYSQKGIYPYRV